MQANANVFDRITVLGEVLFDIFPDGSRVIGGAPFNVSCHLQGLGLDPVFVTRIGADDLGREVLEQMAQWSMSLSGVQMDEQKPTGVVQVRFQNGEPYYEIQEDAAFDHIQPWDWQVESTGKKGLLYHGTLAARGETTAQTIYSMASKSNQEVFCDINLRDPWWSQELIQDVLTWCRYLKVNLQELHQVAEILGLQGSETVEVARMVQEEADLECLVLTLGADGAMLFPRDREYLFSPAPQVRDFKDAVGAGDAFSAVILLGLSRNWSWERVIQRAVFAAAQVCAIQGAVPISHEFYQAMRQAWINM